MDITYRMMPGPEHFTEAVDAAVEAVQESFDNIGKVANDAVTWMMAKVTVDTTALRESIHIIRTTKTGDNVRYLIGGTAKNRSGKEYGIFEHLRHEGTSFIDEGERFANDALSEGTSIIIGNLI